MYTLFKRVRADISMRGIGKLDSSILTKPGVCVRAWVRACVRLCMPVRVFTHVHPLSPTRLFIHSPPPPNAAELACGSFDAVLCCLPSRQAAALMHEVRCCCMLNCACCC